MRPGAPIEKRRTGREPARGGLVAPPLRWPGARGPARRSDAGGSATGARGSGGGGPARAGGTRPRGTGSCLGELEGEVAPEDVLEVLEVGDLVARLGLALLVLVLPGAPHADGDEAQAVRRVDVVLRVVADVHDGRGLE